MWDVSRAVEYLNKHAEQGSVAYCARYVKNAISAGGDISPWPAIESAKDYGSALLDRGFNIISSESGFISGDVVIIQGFRKVDFPEYEIKRDHPHGHMAMFNGQQWVSDFKQNNGYYPGGDYRKAKPACVFYRHKDVQGEGAPGTVIAHGKKMNICYPFRDTDGKEFDSLDKIMRLIDAEAHGTWLLGGNQLWHGGIHISDVSNPFSSLNMDALNNGEPVPLQFMADGTIVAYRINNDYLKGPYKGQQLRYSSTFVLVKSLCQPDPQKEESWLEFYSLYMHLAPVKDYPASPCYKVKAGHSGILLRKYINGQNGLPEGQESGDYVTYQAPPKTSKKLNTADRFVSSRTGRFYITKNNQTYLMTFGLVRLLNGETTGNEQYWVTLDPALMEQDGEIQALMPAWMQKAKAKGEFDRVQLGGETAEWRVSAGTPVGFMGCEEYPGEGGGQVEREWFVHLEVLSADARMPTFLSNPADVKGEKRTVMAPKGKMLYARQSASEQETFTATAATLGAQCVLPRETTTPVMDESQQWWFNISGSGWLPQKDVEEVGQYDLLKLGFQPLEENSSGDMTYSPYEGWVPEAFGSISRAAEQGDEWQYEQVPPYYRQLMAEMDKDSDGKVTEEEIRQALVVRDPLVRKVVNHLTVKHYSEWYGGRSTGRWEEFYKDLDTDEVAYCEKWQTDLEWMSEVSPFNCDNPVWHFHPVVFLDAIKFSALSLEEARVRAFMRMIRVCEGTTGEDGYEKLFGGESFIKDYHRTFSTHPQIKIKRTNKKSGKTYISSAAGAYQVMGYTWDDPSTIFWRKKYDILDFSPSSQDLLCVAILKEKVRNDALNMIVHGKIKEAIEDSCSYEWASLPPGRHGQPIKSISECLNLYKIFFDEELNWNTDLHINYGFLKDFLYE